MQRPFAIAVAVLALGACGPGEPVDTGPPPVATWDDPFTADEAAVVLQMSPLDAPPADPTNAWADDPGAAHLGQYLFYDGRFSGDGSVSCAICHNPAVGFSDGKRVAEGIDGAVGTRKAPGLWNTAYNRWMFWDGRADSFWDQAIHPLEDPDEMGGNRLAAIHVFDSYAPLKEAYEAVFGPFPDVSDLSRFPADARPVLDPADPMQVAWAAMSPADQQTVNVFLANFGKALEAYERTIVTRHAPIDDFVTAYRTGDVDALNATDPEVLVGAKIFAGRGNCHLCHLGATFSNEEFHNIGLGERDWLPVIDEGRYAGIPDVLADPFNGVGAYSDDPSFAADKLEHLPNPPTGEACGQFKVPGLRNVDLVAPYMHGGHFDALEDVVDFYSALDEEPAPCPTGGHREDLMKPLDLTDDEKAGVVAFLRSLTGDDLDGVAVLPPDSPVP